MRRLTKSTLTGICEQMASHSWSDDEIEELVNPKMGMITGFQELLDELERLRTIDLGATPPAMNVQVGGRHG